MPACRARSTPPIAALAAFGVGPPIAEGKGHRELDFIHTPVRFIDAVARTNSERWIEQRTVRA